MADEQISLVTALKNYFEKTPPTSQKIEISEFKDLTYQDRVELRQMLIDEGYDVAPLKEQSTP